MKLPLIMCALASTIAAVEPVVENGNMSEGNAVPTGWEGTWSKTGTFTPTRDAAVFASAPASLKVEVSGDNPDGNVHQELHGVAGKRIRVTGKIRVAGAGITAGVAVQAFDGKSTQLLWQDIAGGLKAGASFVPFDGTAAVPAEGTRVLVTVFAAGAGTYWLDDVEVSVLP